MRKLVLLRHGQSQWNLDNRFTGSVGYFLLMTGNRGAFILLVATFPLFLYFFRHEQDGPERPLLDVAIVRVV